METAECIILQCSQFPGKNGKYCYMKNDEFQVIGLNLQQHCVTAIRWCVNDSYQRAVLPDHCLFVVDFNSTQPLHWLSCFIAFSCLKFKYLSDPIYTMFSVFFTALYLFLYHECYILNYLVLALPFCPGFGSHKDLSCRVFLVINLASHDSSHCFNWNLNPFSTRQMSWFVI